MILDQLSNASLYEGVSEPIAAALKYLKETDFSRLPTGKVVLRDTAMFAIVQDYQSRPVAQCLWESHRKYIDVQFVASGSEVIGHSHIANLRETKAYSEADDVALYEGDGNMITVPAGWFTVFFPEDGHKPCAAVNDQPSPVRKVVVKIAVGS